MATKDKGYNQLSERREEIRAEDGPRPLPLGPFVNRNHFATWAIMVIPLCLGYLGAHAQVHRSPGKDSGGSLSSGLPRIAWLIVSIVFLSAALVIAANVIIFFAAGQVRAACSPAPGRPTTAPRTFGIA